jgi:3-methyladenine DNA glycosylase/8-oxoguanine DNA glycosylase
VVRFELVPKGPFSLAASAAFLEGFAPAAHRAGDPDHLPEHEPRLRRAVALAYGLDGPPGDLQLAQLAERWRPYRTWVVLLLRVLLEETTSEIRGAGG